MKVLQRPRGPGIPRGEFKNLTVRSRGTKSNLTVRILQVTKRYLLVLSWGSSWSPWGTSWSHREVPLSHNKNPPGECKLLHIPYHEETSWSHGEVFHGHDEVPLVLTVRFLLVTTRNLLVNVKFDLHPYQEGTSWSHGEVFHGHHEVPLVLTVRFLLVTTRNLLVNVTFDLPWGNLSVPK